MQEIKSLSQFNSLLKSSQLLVVDFWATWCGPCKTISPIFERLSKNHAASASIVFAKCDVDKASEIAKLCGITAMPTFQFYKDGKKIDELKGADAQRLTYLISTHTSAVLKEGPKASASSSKPPSGPSGPNTLRPLIETSTSRILGSTLSAIRNIVSPPPAGYAVASAAGSARFLIHLSFAQPITPSHLKFTVAKDSAPNAPSRIQVGSNVAVRFTKDSEGVETNDLGMDALGKAENTQAFNVFSDEYVHGAAELKLKASKFTAIKSLTILVTANLSGDEKTISKLGELDIVGMPA